jgi:hypothetical protein
MPRDGAITFAQAAEIAWIMSLSSVSCIFVTCSAVIKDTTK